MIRKGVIIDTSKFQIVRECTYDDTLIESMFVRVDGKDLIPLAYVYPIERKSALEGIMAQCALARKTYDDFIANVFYKQLPTLRA